MTNFNIKTLDVLGGAYRGRAVEARKLLSHVVINDNGVERVGCSQPLDNLCDEYGSTDINARPTCKRCAKVWDRLQAATSRFDEMRAELIDLGLDEDCIPRLVSVNDKRVRITIVAGIQHESSFEFGIPAGHLESFIQTVVESAEEGATMIDHNWLTYNWGEVL